MQHAGNYVQTFTGFSQSKADCNCLVRGCLPPGDPYLVIEGVKHPKSLDYQLVGASTHYPVIKREKKKVLQPLIYPKFLPYFYSATRKRRHSVKHCCNKLFSAFKFSALSCQVWTKKTINQCKPARYTWVTKPGNECVCMPPLCSIHNSS